jgi:coenzyme F420 hydrogenase subunit beta
MPHDLVRTDPPAAATGPWAPPLAEAAPRALCTDCGLSRTAQAKACGQACQFLRPDYDRLEAQAHGARATRRGRTNPISGRSAGWSAPR